MDNNQEYPLLSALMVVNKGTYPLINRAINCFSSQTYPNKELIIVNNATTQLEASDLIIDATPNVFVIDTPTLLNIGQARNYGISAANGQILAQFDVDCWHSPQRLQLQIAAMAENSSHVCLLSSASRYSVYSKEFINWTNDKNAILNSMVFIRPKNVDYPNLQKSEELHLLIRLAELGGQVSSLNAPHLLCKIVGPISDLEYNKLFSSFEL